MVISSLRWRFGGLSTWLSLCWAPLCWNRSCWNLLCWNLLCWTCGLGWLLTGTLAIANVVVVANRTPANVTLSIFLSESDPWGGTLSPGQSRPIFSDGPVSVALEQGASIARYALEPSAIYFLGTRRDGQIDLQKIAVGDGPAIPPPLLPGSAATTPAATLPVKILVDEEEPARQFVWEAKLRKRVEAASQLLHRHAMIRLQVVAVDRWQSDNAIKDFAGSLAEFEQEVQPTPAELAIGFTSQYQVQKGRVHLGGTHGPLRPHILIREWSKHVSEQERLELLAHELGHYLGAVHSPEPDSVMRPILGDRQSRKVGFVVRYDPVNTLIMSMVGEEIRRGRVSRFSQLTIGTKQRLNQIYHTLGVALPEDSSGQTLARQLQAPRVDPVTLATQRVLGRVAAAARQNRQLPPGEQLTGDGLFDFYVQTLAQAALAEEEKYQQPAFLRGLGASLIDPQQFAKIPGVAPLLNRLEPPAERARRLKWFGKPTLQGRQDWAQHFGGAAMLVAVAGEQVAETASVAKEGLDAMGKSGFSFTDLAADKAGIVMASKLLTGELTLATLAAHFQARDYVPPLTGLPEGLSSVEFMRQFGGQHDTRYLQVIQQMERSIAELPAYQQQRRQE